MTKWDIKFYKNNRGDECVKDFIRHQDVSTRAKIVRAIDLLTIYGPNLVMPYGRNMKNGLYELRINGKNCVRIFYIFKQKNTVYLLHAFKKKTQKTPKNELEVALKRQKELTKI